MLKDLRKRYKISKKKLEQIIWGNKQKQRNNMLQEIIYLGKRKHSRISKIIIIIIRNDIAIKDKEKDIDSNSTKRNIVLHTAAVVII